MLNKLKAAFTLLHLFSSLGRAKERDGGRGEREKGRGGGLGGSGRSECMRVNQDVTFPCRVV